MTTPIQVTDLHKSYGTVAAVDGLGFEVAQGETVAILGPNGAGKTTTVEILEGFRRADSGEVRVLGVDPATADRAWRDRIGIVSQSCTGLDLLTPREIIASTALAYRNPLDVDHVIEVTGLATKANARIRGLSGGQRRRVDMALGIVGRPELLFLDEPTTGFDPQARRDFWSLIRALGEDGTTIVLTTHYLDEAEALASRVGIIAAGRMVALGTPSELGGSGRTSTLAWDEGGRRATLHTDRPTAEIARLASRFGGEVPGLTVSRRSLEETYLALIGPQSAVGNADEVAA
ncbi:ABC transporter ATP-binding protein [Nostocoides australiense]|nr:ABC transporter ATP-binding protein [Tetrasphaera australiensis]